ncbi:MAG TPA: hypothetical protein VI978_02555 [Candidatus Paceibacterota bacterium]
MSNEVDVLFEKIRKIQKECGHRFFLMNAYKPKKTLEKGTFRTERGVMACCLYCSKEVEIDMTKMCPCCFGEMTRLKESKGSIDQLYNCKKCNYTVHQLGEIK